MYGGHLSADPNITRASSTDITPHLYFFMVKNRRTADRERIVFWFNVCPFVLYVLTEHSNNSSESRVVQDVRRSTVQ